MAILSSSNELYLQTFKVGHETDR